VKVVSTVKYLTYRLRTLYQASIFEDAVITEWPSIFGMTRTSFSSFVSFYSECVSFVGVKCVSKGTNEFYSLVFRCVTLAEERTKDEVVGHHQGHFTSVELKVLRPLKSEVRYYMPLSGVAVILGYLSIVISFLFFSFLLFLSLKYR
jgi:hypothetical protein